MNQKEVSLSELFSRCLSVEYTHVENSADYALEKIGDTLYLYFEWTKEKEDWISNFNFPAKPYKRMGKTAWFAHRGFLKVWKTIEKYIVNDIMDKSVKQVVIVGYSQGAAIAALCHEYIWYNRPDLRNSIDGYGFGCPRVFWGFKSKELKQRWERFTVIRNIGDIVTHVPPAIFGFSHVGNMVEVGAKKKYSCIDAHRPENFIVELKEYDESRNLV